MSTTPNTPNDSDESSKNVSLAHKIAKLVEERGWNQETFATKAGLNRQTVRTILLESDRTLRNNTVAACARALGVGVNDLRTLPLDKLLTKMYAQPAAAADAKLSLRERATHPELAAWLDRNPDRASDLTPEEEERLLEMQGQEDPADGKPFGVVGVEQLVRQMERRREIADKIDSILGSEYDNLFEQFVNLIYERIVPYRDRA